MHNFLHGISGILCYWYAPVFSYTEFVFFCHLINATDPKYISSSQTCLTVISELYHETKNIVCDISLSPLSLTMPGWTWRATESYNPLNEKQLNYCKLCSSTPPLHTHTLHENHNSVNIGDALKTAVTKWNLKHLQYGIRYCLTMLSIWRMLQWNLNSWLTTSNILSLFLKWTLECGEPFHSSITVALQHFYWQN